MTPIAGFNLALETIQAGQLLFSKLVERQQKREAEGKQITEADVDALIAEGDVKEAMQRAQLAAAKVAQASS